jgi:inorganic triphosphatase YgiF
MAIETELKLRIAPEHLNRLKRHPLLKKLSSARAVTRKLHSVYYDTPDLELRQRAMALRLRRVGKQWLQTLKGGGSVQAGMHQRNEWEVPLGGEKLDFNALEAGGSPRLSSSVRKKLQPLFVTEFSRTIRLLDFGGAVIELGMDSGEIRAGQASRPISELELELKFGDPQQLFKLALALLDIAPLEVEFTSKAEYGYRLFAQAKPGVVKATELDLSKCPDVPCALQAMIWSCLSHLQANVPGAVNQLDEEYLHQVRVALRRLRVVLSLAKKIRTDSELGKLHEQVAGLCVELGRTREWDVFVTQTLMPIRAQLPDHAGLREVLRASKQLREQQHTKVREGLQSQVYQRLLLRFGVWMHGDYWSEPAGMVSPVLPSFAARILEKHNKRVHKLGKHLAGANAARRHALRIACKRLRYSAELFSSLLGTAKTLRYVETLSQLQDILGALNDITIAHRLLEDLDSKERRDTLAFIRRWMQREYEDRLGALGKVWKRFAGKKAFWSQAVTRR